MNRRQAKKLKTGDRLVVGGDVCGIVKRVNRKSVTFLETDYGCFGDGLPPGDLPEVLNLPFDGQWDDIEKPPR